MTLKEISKTLNLEINEQIEITSLNTLLDSNENELTFLENKKYLYDL